jgi:sulfate adenylyltransferase
MHVLDETKTGSEPHGGTLVDRQVSGEEAVSLAEEAQALTLLELSERQRSDVEMIAIGGFSPLTGFMGQDDYRSVIGGMHLANGLAWSMPIVLAPAGDSKTIRPGSHLALSSDGVRFAMIEVEDLYPREKSREVQSVFRTSDAAHPGVAAVLGEGDVAIAGPITVFGAIPGQTFPNYRIPPVQTRRSFAERGWKTIVGFQTRNPVHRAHEYLHKCAMEIVDGLLLHPLVGETKSDDVPADIRMRSYEALLEKYYPSDRVLLAVNPAAMRYAGPREAIFHALIRKNYGCTHFIVGRDHAGVPGYYGPYDAQHIFSEFGPDELGIVPLFFENSFFCRTCGNMATEKTCPHDGDQRVTLSGTQVRAMLSAGELPPVEYSRPEVASILSEGMRRDNS